MTATAELRRNHSGERFGRGVGRPPSRGDDGRGDGGGGGSRWVELVKASNDIEAHLLAGRLLEAGVESRSVKDRYAPGAWLYGGSNPWAPVTVMVRSLDLQSARLVLAEVALSIDEVPPRPPRKEMQSTSRLVWWAAALALGMFFTGIALAQTENRLARCDGRILCVERPGPDE